MSKQEETKHDNEEKKFEITTKNRQYLPFKATQEEQWQGAFTFIQAADTQLGLQERYIEKKSNPGWSKEIEWTRKMVEDINRMQIKPRFLVICGDLIDAYPTKQQEKERKEQESDLKRELNRLKIPLVCVCGNHDVGDRPNEGTVAKYRSSFGDDYFSFWCGGVYFLVLNSQYWQDSTDAENLSKEHDDWLNAQLHIIKTKKPHHAVVFQHIPPFINEVDETKQYFNLEPVIRKDILNRFQEAGVKYVFCGHYHRNAGGNYGEVEVIVTSAVGAQLGDDVNGYRVVNVSQDCIKHRYYGLGSIDGDGDGGTE